MLTYLPLTYLLTAECPVCIFPNCMLLIVIPFPPANQRVWRVWRQETRTVDEGVSYVRLLTSA